MDVYPLCCPFLEVEHLNTSDLTTWSSLCLSLITHFTILIKRPSYINSPSHSALKLPTMAWLLPTEMWEIAPILFSHFTEVSTQRLAEGSLSDACNADTDTLSLFSPTCSFIYLTPPYRWQLYLRGAEEERGYLNWDDKKRRDEGWYPAKHR